MKRRIMKRFFTLFASMLIIMQGAFLLTPQIASAQSAGSVYSWGTEGFTYAVPTPDDVYGALGIDAGNYSDLAILPGGTVDAWGASELGFKSTAAVHQVPELTDVVQLADGDKDFAALEDPDGPLEHGVDDGTCPAQSSVWVWGLNDKNDLGLDLPTGDRQTTPVELSALSDIGVVQIVAASWHMFALTCTGQVYAWGSNSKDDLGVGKGVAGYSTPTLDANLTALTGGTSAGVMIETGSFAADMLVDGQLYGWGNNGQGECACGTGKSIVATPRSVTAPVPFVYVDSGGDYASNGHTLALDASGNVHCWGDNERGQCGQGYQSATVAVPTLVPGVTGTDVEAGGAQSLVLDGSGDVWAFGDNKFGEVGIPGSSVVTTPTVVLSGMSMISAGAEHSEAG